MAVPAYEITIGKTRGDERVGITRSDNGKELRPIEATELSTTIKKFEESVNSKNPAVNDAANKVKDLQRAGGGSKK